MKEYLDTHIPEAGLNLYREDQESKILKAK